MQIEFSKRFIKQFQKLRASERERFYHRLVLWQENAASPALRVHGLVGRYSGYYSLNVGGDLRAIYKLVSTNHVLFEAIGTHSQLYG